MAKPDHNKNIWVVDDDPAILEVMEIVLNEEGYHVQVIGNADTIKQKLQEEKPDVILLDVLMSGLDGREVARNLKSNKATKSIPIIMVSADYKVEQKAQEAGADDFITKPFNIEDLIAVIEKHTKS